VRPALSGLLILCRQPTIRGRYIFTSVDAAEKVRLLGRGRVKRGEAEPEKSGGR
jgi:hypothetical protein